MSFINTKKSKDLSDKLLLVSVKKVSLNIFLQDKYRGVAVSNTYRIHSSWSCQHL